MKVNEEQTKHVTVKGNRKQTVPEPYIQIMECKFERVCVFMYLGSLIDENGNMKEEISRRIQNTSVTVDCADTFNVYRPTVPYAGL